MKDKIFSDADESALSIVPTDRSTRNSLEGNRLSLISDDGDVQYIRFSFEDALFTSHVYKRNYRFLLRQPSQPVETNRAAKEMSHDNSNLVPDATVLPNAATALRGEADDWFPAADISKSVAVSKHGPQDEDKSRPDTAVVAVSFARKKDLIQALSQANVAVLRDNMSDLEGAVVCYQASCNILDQIVVVTKVKTDRDKVIAIVSLDRYLTP